MEFQLRFCVEFLHLERDVARLRFIGLFRVLIFLF